VKSEEINYFEFGNPSRYPE